MSSGPIAHAPPVRSGFARADDGLNLYWRAVGTGPAMVCCNGVGVSTFFWKYLVDHFCERYTVVLWDYRGHGRSDAVPDPLTSEVGIPRHTRDLAAVMQAVGLERAMLVGHSMGCQVIFEAWRAFPERVHALVPLLGTAGRALDTFFDNPNSPRYFELAARVIRRLGARTHLLVRPVVESPLAWAFTRRAALVDPYYARREDMLTYLRHLASLDMRMFIRTVLMMNEHDAWGVLPDITVPVLVIAAERDTFTPMRMSRRMVELIPGAEMLVLADGSHAALIEQPETINHRIERFIAERGVFPAG